ncbi:hypothetical protein [Aeromonas veronii]|uniref:hypothetical protein n=1 Tax=Aeromonas veronii TaxID=654 RepID=UPI0019349A87|nr:hypothetical protein [Aeromonas veronii]MBM0415946.1 hypothetical protein [Aeromonas veronii]MBW3789202.1 hypothetical protein [Aeromonas veronii]
MHQFECIHPYNACKQFDSGLLQKVGVLIVGLSNKILKGDKIPGFVFETTGSLGGEFFTGYSNKLLLERVGGKEVMK